MLAGGAALLAQHLTSRPTEDHTFPLRDPGPGRRSPREELAGHKLLALFDRAAARDFADVYVLARRFGKDALITRVTRIDSGFDTKVLADTMVTLDRFADSEVPVPSGSSAAELRAF